MLLKLYNNILFNLNLLKKLLKKILKKIYFYFRQKSIIDKNIERQLASRIISKKKSVAKNFKYFDYNPLISIIITSYNHSKNIDVNYKNIKNYKISNELIVCEDGSLDGSYEKWTEKLNLPNEFLIKTNELNEFFIFDRAINLSKGEIVCLLQDDDLIPDNSKWIKEAINLFNEYKDLVIIGCNQGYIFDDPKNKFKSYMQICGSDHPRILNKERKIQYLDKNDKEPVFKFVHAINIGPVFIKSSFYREIGGFDLKKIGVGNPGIHFDWDISLQAYKYGKRVALLNVENIKRRVGGAGSLMFDIEKRNKKYYDNLEYLNKKYEVDFLKNLFNKIN